MYVSVCAVLVRTSSRSTPIPHALTLSFYQISTRAGGSWRTQTSGSTTAAAAASRAWQGGGADEQHGPFSNGLLAAVIALPLILTGAWMGRTMPNNVERTWRRHGLMQPPVNPWLREDLQPKTKSHGWGFVDWPSRGDPQPSV